MAKSQRQVYPGIGQIKVIRREKVITLKLIGNRLIAAAILWIFTAPFSRVTSSLFLATSGPNVYDYRKQKPGAFGTLG